MAMDRNLKTFLVFDETTYSRVKGLQGHGFGLGLSF